MIPGVEQIGLGTHYDERGFFREILRHTNITPGSFAQWSHAVRYTGTIVAWHIHRYQTDYWYCLIGNMKAVLADMRTASWDIGNNFQAWIDKPLEIEEYHLGEHHMPFVLKIPPGVAHGFKILDGPCHLFYITDKVYNPDDEGRIPYDALGYDWLERVIK